MCLDPDAADLELVAVAAGVLRADAAGAGAGAGDAEWCRQNCDGDPEGHPVSWRVYPCPAPDAEGVLTGLIECCTCCAWPCGRRGEGFMDRARREAGGRDITIERFDGGRWVGFGWGF